MAFLLLHKMGQPAGVAIRVGLHGQGAEGCHVSLPAGCCSWGVAPASQPGGNKQFLSETSNLFVAVAATPGLLLPFLVDRKRTRKTMCLGGAGVASAGAFEWRSDCAGSSCRWCWR